MARTRTIFGTHANLAHTWAQQSFTIGHSADRRMFFEGDTIFSYGRHYAMARFTDLRDFEGKRVVLFKSGGYSVSTAKHRNHTHGALRGLGVAIVYVDDVNAGYASNVAVLKRHFNNAAEQLASPTRNRHVDLASRLVELQNRADTVRDFAAIYGEALGEWEGEVTALADKITAAMNAFNDPAKLAKRAKDKARRDTAKAVTLIRNSLEDLANGRLEPSPNRGNMRACEEAIELWLASGRDLAPLAPIIRMQQQCLALHEQEALANVIAPNAAQVLADRRWRSYGSAKPVTQAEWLEGVGAASQYGWGYNVATLVRRKGDRLETSRGAEVPFKHAVLAYLKACECRRTGTTWHRNGEKVAVGVYQLDAIDAEGNIMAGCHTIGFNEMQRLALREVPHLVRASFPVPALIAA
jgi:hypothetical protein